jgi:DNA helicase II / ATP-dependent DNA helicase PcrA
VYAETGYALMLQAKEDPENEARRENVSELVGSMKSYQEEEDEPSLTEYLERVTLAETTPEGETAERISLMTVHAAKGLEFKVVFIAALEEGMFPYKGTELGADPSILEEERRLAYVAITRAREQLVLLYTNFRQIFGQTRPGIPSRFLEEIPEELLTAPIQKRNFGMSALQRTSGGSWGARLSKSNDEDSDEQDDTPHRGPVLVREGYSDIAPDDDGAPSLVFRRGMRVKHATWGPGNVRAVIPGPEVKIEVYFPSVGQAKILLAQYLKPL